MCGRYALALPPWRVRQMLQDSNMPADDAPADDDARQSYNFAPGYYGLVYRQDGPDHGAAGSSQQSRPPPADRDSGQEQQEQELEIEQDTADTHATDTSNVAQDTHNEQNLAQPPDHDTSNHNSGDTAPSTPPRYKLQAMTWGLTPFWTKRRPDYATILRTINCRDDSLARSGGMWHTMKQKKRCIVLAQGFFEWLKKNDGKDKIPHFIKRKDGQLMCFAGLWDSVKYDDRDDKHYSYTIITTDANKQISFLHDRMPVLFENGSDDMFKWIDSNRSEWSKELQSLLKPYTGELEIYPVTKDMNRAGTSSPNFIVPIDDSKQSISHFFGKKGQGSSQSPKKEPTKLDTYKTESSPIKTEPQDDASFDIEEATTTAPEGINNETNAPLPATPSVKRLREDDDIGDSDALASILEEPHPKLKTPKTSRGQPSPSKPITPISSKRTKSATSNTAVSTASPSKANQKITSFFKK